MTRRATRGLLFGSALISGVGFAGDRNADGIFGTRLDCEIAAIELG